MNKQDQIARIQVAVSQLHNCGAIWREFIPLHEIFQERRVWKNEDEVFDLHNNRNAKRAHAWSHSGDANDDRERFAAVLEIPPVDSAQKAVQIQIEKDAKGRE